jgi:hypothetical protein
MRKMFTPVNAIGVMALAIGLSGTAVAATGGNFILGGGNSADRTTTLRNTGAGPAFSVRVANPSTAPLSVGTNKTKIPYLNSDLLDGLDSGALQRKFVRTVIVSPGVTAVASGTALRAALAAITTASATKPYLVHVEPGIYDVGTTPFLMKSYVDLEGSGRGVTTITGAIANDPASATVVLAGAMELRHVAVRNSASVEFLETAAIKTPADGTASLLDVDARATSTFSGSGVGLLDDGGGTGVVVVDNSNLEAPNGIGVQSALPLLVLRNSTVTGGLVGIFLANYSSTVHAFGLQLTGGITDTGINVQCLASYSGAWALLTNKCQPPP